MGSQAIKGYKNSEDFKGEISEAAYDAFPMGFIECKGKVTKAFPDLDLRNIVVEELELLEEEEEVEAEVVGEAIVVKTKKFKVEGAKEVGLPQTLKKLRKSGPPMTHYEGYRGS